jgi:hypothetical protein
MDRLIDLDRAAELIEARRRGWESSGITAGHTTWRDEREPWPQKLHNDRGSVVDPDSVGVRLERGYSEAEVVLFRGGWADVQCGRIAGSGQTVNSEAPEVRDLASFARLLDTTTQRVLYSED